MKPTSQRKEQAVKTSFFQKQYTYNEIIEYLNNHWLVNINDPQLTCIKKLDHAFDNLSEQQSTILITGTNGKSITSHFAAKLLAHEGLTVGTFTAPHVLTYNERFAINNEAIPNKLFTDIANEVINTAESLELEAHTTDLLTMMALLYFKKHNVDVSIIELSHERDLHPATICKPAILALTRATPDNQEITDATIEHALIPSTPKTHVISGDQSKLNLQIMQSHVEKKGAIWAMPIRKLAALPYPYEQLHGRCAALAERIAYIYVNDCVESTHYETKLANSILTKEKGQRGRPTLEAKKQSELNPKKTVEQFWRETTCDLSGKFQLLNKEKPSVLLDNASNLDAFKNLLLGIRLLHYNKPIKGLTLIVGLSNPIINMIEFLKLLRYFFKKTTGQIILCHTNSNHEKTTTWDIEAIAHELKNMKIKARAMNSFKEAFDTAQKTVDDRYGLIAITGSTEIVSEYWHYRGIKKV